MDRRRLSPLEAVLIGVFVLLCGTAIGRLIGLAEVGGPALVVEDVLADLRGKYGPEKYSQGYEEWILRDLLQDRRNGVFVDVGAYDAVRYSNTYRFERDFGWSGLAIDALKEYAPSYSVRPRTSFVVAFVGPVDSGTSELNINPKQPGVSSGVRTFTAQFTDTIETRQVQNRTLNSLLREHHIDHVDLVSMDIELGEPGALAGFDIARYQPAVVVVEAQGETRQPLLDYFARVGYVLQGRYLLVDPQNFYFRPIAR